MIIHSVSLDVLLICIRRTLKYFHLSFKINNFLMNKNNKTFWSVLCEEKFYDYVVSLLAPYYEKFFPIEIRFFLAEWFENEFRCHLKLFYN